MKLHQPVRLISLTFFSALVSRVIFGKECRNVVVCWGSFGLLFVWAFFRWSILGFLEILSGPFCMPFSLSLFVFFHFYNPPFSFSLCLSVPCLFTTTSISFIFQMCCFLFNALSSLLLSFYLLSSSFLLAFPTILYFEALPQRFNLICFYRDRIVDYSRFPILYPVQMIEMCPCHIKQRWVVNVAQQCCMAMLNFFLFKGLETQVSLLSSGLGQAFLSPCSQK